MSSGDIAFGPSALNGLAVGGWRRLEESGWYAAGVVESRMTSGWVRGVSWVGWRGDWVQGD